MSAESDFAIGRALQGEVCWFDEIEDIVVLDIHFNDASAPGEGLRVGGLQGNELVLSTTDHRWRYGIARAQVRPGDANAAAAAPG